MTQPPIEPIDIIDADLVEAWIKYRTALFLYRQDRGIPTEKPETRPAMFGGDQA